MAQTYDPAEVTLNFGPHLISGFADGVFITVARNDPENYKGHDGADGEFSWTKSNKNSGTITFMLKSTSPSRAVLAALKEVILPCWVRNLSDAKYAAGGAEARLKTEPTVEFGDEEQMIEYIIEVANLQGSALS